MYTNEIGKKYCLKNNSEYFYILNHDIPDSKQVVLMDNNHLSSYCFITSYIDFQLMFELYKEPQKDFWIILSKNSNLSSDDWTLFGTFETLKDAKIQYACNIVCNPKIQYIIKRVVDEDLIGESL